MYLKSSFLSWVGHLLDEVSFISNCLRIISYSMEVDLWEYTIVEGEVFFGESVLVVVGCPAVGAWLGWPVHLMRDWIRRRSLHWYLSIEGSWADVGEYERVE